MHKHLKKVIHPNRWFIWALVFAIVACLTLTAWLMINAYRIDTEASFVPLSKRMNYTDIANAYSVQHPEGWQLEKDSATTVTFSNPKDNAEYISVDVYTDKNADLAIKRSIDIANASTVKKNGYVLTKLQVNADQKNSIVQPAAIIKTDSRTYYVSGNSRFFDTFINHFNIVKK